MQHVAHGVISPAAGLELPARLGAIFEELEDVVAKWKPQAAAIEQVFTARSPRAALVLGHARGAAVIALHRGGMVVGEYAPAEVKLSVAGHGRASKEQLAGMVGRLLGINLSGVALDATDALAVAICHAHGRRRERLVDRARGGAR